MIGHITMSNSNLIKDFDKALKDRGLVISNSTDVNQIPPVNYSLARQIINKKDVLVPFLIHLALSLKDNNGHLSYIVKDIRDKGIIQQFLENIKRLDLISRWRSIDVEGNLCYEVEVSKDEKKRRFFRSEWAELCFRHIIMRVVQQFCTSKATPLSYKPLQNVKITKAGDNNLFTELDLVVQIEKRFYVFEIKSGPWIRIMQWAKHENAFVYKDSPIRNIVCTVHDDIPAHIFEPQVLWSLKNIESCLGEMLRGDFPMSEKGKE
ncbi:MAG: hypothetical protein J6T19_01035 [Paludibacteraceae bacterium]|nr:hypothetical protein [Paludibacteraceae bacterium]